MNRLTEQTFANGDRWSHVYNWSGTLQKKTDPQLRETTHTYDSRHRLDEAKVTGTVLESDRDYDAAGRLSAVVDSSIQVLPITSTDTIHNTSGYTYDKLGRIVTETSQGRTHTYDYDLVGNRVSASLQVQGTVPHLLAYDHDALNRVRAVWDNNRTAGDTDDKVIGYLYDLSGQVGQVMLISNLTTTTRVNTTVNEYDPAGRLTVRRLYKGSNEITYDASFNPIQPVLLAGFTWMHDDLGNVTSQTETWMNTNGTLNRSRVTVMTYDDANRLLTETITDQGTAAVTTTYTYDGAANRTGKSVVLGTGTAPAGIEVGHWTYLYNEANQLERWEKRATPSGAVTAGATYGYDANGNRTSKVVDGTTAIAARTYSYGWDAWDRMRETTVPTSATAKKTLRYTYDYRLRRIGRAQAGGALTTQHTAYVFSGGLSVAEYNRTGNTVLTNSSVPTVQYVRGQDMGGGVGGMLYSIRGTTIKYNQSNGRGDIVAQTGSTGLVTWTASYEAFGKQTKETGTNTDTQRANSKDEEEAAGLLNEGFRYRDLETGVWLSRDPAGFVDGPNLYAYVKQNPWTGWDPLGLATKEIGHVYVEINHNSKEYYVGETQRPPAERMNDREHQAKSLREKDGTIGYSRTIVAEDASTEASVKAQRMVVEREIQDHLAKEHPDYKSLGTQRLSDEKYQLAKETTNPRLKTGEAPTEYESQKSFFGSKRSMESVGKASGRVPIGLKVAGAAGLVGMAIMFANGEAAAEGMTQHVEGWRQAVETRDDSSALTFEAAMAQGFTQQNGGPAAAVVLETLAEARVRAQEVK